MLESPSSSVLKTSLIAAFPTAIESAINLRQSPREFKSQMPLHISNFIEQPYSPVLAIINQE
jgi:hypothetical protein